jgi:hypothetical protein
MAEKLPSDGDAAGGKSATSNQSVSGPQIHYGFVAMLDVLGASNYSIEESRDFIKKREELLKKLGEVETMLMKPLKGVPQPVVATFGDTLVFTWAVGEELSLKMLPGVAEWLRHAVRWGLVRGLLLRGALAIGHYVFERATVLGPAISDAASWYEEADWFGVILTPSCQFKLIAFLEHAALEPQLENQTFNHFFVRYKVPVKNGERREMWVISWPYDFLTRGDSKLSALGMFAGTLMCLSIPKGTEAKHLNSLEFFKWYGTEIFPHLTTTRQAI